MRKAHKIKYSEKKWCAPLRAHHLKSLIFQAFRKKTPSQDQGSFNFTKSNKINNLQNLHPRKISTNKTCDAKCDAFWKNSHHFSKKFHLWLRKNLFYIIMELPRVDGKRRYKRISLHTSNYYEARERINRMGITFDREITQQIRLKLAIDSFQTQVALNQIRDEVTKEYNTNYIGMHPEVLLVNQNNTPAPISQDKIDQIVEAGLYAASGMNKQSTKIIVVKNKSFCDKLSAEKAKIDGWFISYG